MFSNQELDDPKMNVSELAKRLKISETTVYRNVNSKKQRWPHFRFGSKILFSENNIEEIKNVNKMVSTKRMLQD